ncbi:YesL family protein [Evansella halocellulosilytica]|uniref:YesL family protein n=1 Tax=Evansella halocellulosilytica TaxID=2011013 RepID=UPI000BB87C21|nr:DUF624 domain-containing protein [Evansella halocellulosilytica]
MEYRGLFKYVYLTMEFITRIAYINLLWIGFSLLGLVVFGLGPASAAMFTVTRQWAIGNYDIPVFKTFFNAYKQNFFRATFLLVPLFIASNILYIDFMYLSMIDGMFYNFMLFIFINALIIFAIVSLYLFPVFVQYKYSIWQYYKYSAIIGFSMPLHTLGMIIAIFLMWRLVLIIPGILPILPIGLLAFVMMKLSHAAFVRIEKKMAASQSIA